MENKEVFSKPDSQSWDFPSAPVVKNLLVNAGDMGLIPGQGRFHMLLSNQAHVPQLLSPHAYSPCSTTGEATTMRNPRTTTREEPLLAATRESLHTAMKIKHNQK